MLPSTVKSRPSKALGTPNNLHPLQQAFITYGSVQCGFCSPGFLMSAKALLDENLNPTREDVRDWFQKNRNVCRCTGYKPIVDGVMAAARVMRGEATMEDITYKGEKDQIYGTKLPRPTALAKVTGQCDFGDDLKYRMPENMLHLAVVQPRITSHAKIVNIDTAPAEAMPGVVRVVTGKDIKGNNIVFGANRSPSRYHQRLQPPDSRRQEDFPLWRRGGCGDGRIRGTSSCRGKSC